MLFRHSLLYVMVRIAAGILGMATTAVLTRILDPETYGTYGVALVIMSFGSGIGFEWLGIAFMRFYQALRDDPRTISTFVYLYLAVVLASALVGGVLALTGAVPADLRTIALAGVVLMWSYSCFELLARVEIVRFEPKRYLWMNLTRGVLTFLGAVLAAWWTRNALWTAIGMSIGMAGGAVFGTSVDFRSILRTFDPKLAKNVLRFGLPLAASATLTGITTVGTRASVGALDSTEALGIYTAAFFLVQNTLTIVSSGLSQASYSMAVRAVETGDTAATRRQLATNGTLLLAVMAPACLGMALTARGISTALVGARFADGVATITPWMAAATFFSALRFHYLDHAFQLGRRPNLLAGVAAVAAVLALILNIVLIPREGAVGAAMALTFTMLLSCVHASIAGRKAFEMPLPLVPAAKIAACSVLMAAAVLSVRGSGLPHLLLKIGLGAVAYTAAAVALNVLETREHLVSLLQRNHLIAAGGGKSP